MTQDQFYRPTLLADKIADKIRSFLIGFRIVRSTLDRSASRNNATRAIYLHTDMPLSPRFGTG